MRVRDAETDKLGRGTPETVQAERRIFGTAFAR